MDPTYPILVAMVVSLALYQLNQRFASPVLSIINRWLRWVVFAAGSAKICTDFGWIDRPFAVLVAIFFLLYFLVETVYRWIEIHAISVSPLPLFPPFVVNRSGEEWPTHPRLLTIRDWLRANGFKQVQALKAEVAPSVYLRVSVYQDSDACLRLQVTFLPHINGAISVCYSLSSQTMNGFRYVTDNLYLPFGGFYPEPWLVERNPWRRSLKGLVARHRARLARSQEPLLPWTDDPPVDLNFQQRQLEQINTELGFLLPYNEREENGKMTTEGRYRVWKEIWLLNYLGRSQRYE